MKRTFRLIGASDCARSHYNVRYQKIAPYQFYPVFVVC